MKILLLLGDSGSGKSTIARYLEKYYNNYHIIKSYTTRAQRNSFDNDHIFIERDKLLKKIFEEEVVACTVINNELYCSFAYQFFVAKDDICIYIVDDVGLLDVYKYFGKNFDIDIIAIRIKGNFITDDERCSRNLNQIIPDSCDKLIIVDNNDTVEECCEKIDVIVKSKCKKQNIYI